MYHFFPDKKHLLYGRDLEYTDNINLSAVYFK